MRRNGHKFLPLPLAILAESFSIDPSDEKVPNSVLRDLLLKLHKPYLFRYDEQVRPLQFKQEITQYGVENFFV